MTTIADRHLTTATYAAVVQADGAVLVYDQVAGSYSRHHRLTEAQVRYVRARAR